MPVIISGLAVVAIVAACSVPGDSSVQEIREADVDFGLAETTTIAPPTTLAATTTVKETTTTIAPTTTAPVAESTTTTTAGPQTEPVDLYFVLGARLAKTTQELVSPVQPEVVIRKLLAGPPEGLRTKLLPIVAQTDGAEVPDTDLPIQVLRKDGVAEVTLPADLVASFGDEAPLAFGQIVLSLVNVDRIGGVVFYVDKAPIQVVKGDGVTLTNAGDAVHYEDYADLVDV